MPERKVDMKYNAMKAFRLLAGRALILGACLYFSSSLAQASEKVILRFNQTLGSSPLSGLTSDSAGNLYGTTGGGGEAGCGTLFELSPNSSGNWTETVLYSFQGCNNFTQTPRGTLLIDKHGNFYGVQQGYFTSGQIFEVSKSGSGKWNYKIIHSFGTNEGEPNPDLTWDNAGNIYGTTQLDSTGFDGEAFELSPQSGGTWKETIIYSFYYGGVGFPVGGPTFDDKGNLYGAAYYGPNGTFGSAYELSPQTGGSWKLTVLSSGAFSEPGSKLTFDSQGNLFGTAGSGDYGEIFELTPGANGKWTETQVHAFSSGKDGSYPQGTLVLDSAGNLYGATVFGGLGCNGSYCGVVYKLSPQAGGQWKETILHQFESAEDGSEPEAGVFLDSSGNIFGTTATGGTRYGFGTVYEITP